MKKELTAVPFKGVRPDSLGNYFVGLGLIAALSKKYPQIRGCWRDGHFVLVGDSLSEDAVKDYLLNEWQPIPYDRWWSDIQKKDTKAQTDQGLWQARSKEKNSNRVRLLDAHIVGSRRNQFNRVLGTGGNVGKRDLAKTSKDAWQSIQKSKSQDKACWLEQTLYEISSGTIPKLNNTGTWFVSANKTFNSGQDWFREGEISPWSFLLALEGVMLLVGGVNRRLGSRSRPYAVFPFLTESPSPKSEGEIGYFKAELWSPIWGNPMNLSELRSLLERGLARIGERAAKSPHEFALAAMSAGVDVGVTSFARFVLRQTTSSQVYEAIPREKVKVNQTSSHESVLIESLIPWIDRLPYEPTDRKQKGKFKGLRGPVEEAIVSLAANPNDVSRWQQLWLLLTDTQGKLDRNQSLRGKSRALPWLDNAWFEKAWPKPPAEIQIARAIASIGAGTDAPIIGNIFGVTLDKYKKLVFDGEQRPQRVAWHNGGLLTVLPALLQRRLIDAESKDELPRPPLVATRKCPPEILSAFINKSLDDEMIGRWIPALSLVNWSTRSNPTTDADKSQSESLTMAGAYLLQALFRPLFCPFNPSLFGEKFFSPHLSPRAMTARRLLNLIRQSSWDEAIQLAQSRYLASGHNIVTTPVIGNVNGELIASALLVPLSVNEIARSLSCWLKPKKYSN
jgi:CRISPR-associated protein Csx17